MHFQIIYPYPDTGDQCSQLIVATLVPSTPTCLFFNLAKLQRKQTVVTDFCLGFVNKIHIIGKGMIKEKWIAKMKSDVEQKNWSHFVLFHPFPRGLKGFQILRSSKYRLELRLWAWRAMHGSTHRRKQWMREALTQDHLPYIGKLNPGCSSLNFQTPCWRRCKHSIKVHKIKCNNTKHYQ